MIDSENNLAATLLQHEEDHIPMQGIDLNSFLHLIVQKNKSCAVNVTTDQKQGILYFDKGSLIDAEHNTASGLEGAYKILSWQDVTISVGKTEKRPQQIASMLSKTLIKAEPTATTQAKQPADQPEEKDVKPGQEVEKPLPVNLIKQSKSPDIELKKRNLTYTLSEAKTDPTYVKPLNILTQIDTIQTFFLLNMAGKVAVHSAMNSDIGDLIIYAIVTCSKLKKSVDTTSLKRIQMQMDDETTLLILPLSTIIIGIIVQPGASADEIVDQLQGALQAALTTD